MRKKITEAVNNLLDAWQPPQIIRQQKRPENIVPDEEVISAPATRGVRRNKISGQRVSRETVSSA